MGRGGSIVVVLLLDIVHKKVRSIVLELCSWVFYQERVVVVVLLGIVQTNKTNTILGDSRMEYSVVLMLLGIANHKSSILGESVEYGV